MGRRNRKSVKKVYSTGKSIKVAVVDDQPYQPLSQSIGIIKKREKARALQTVNSLIKPTEKFMSKVQARNSVLSLFIIVFSLMSCKKEIPTPNPTLEVCYVQENIQNVYGTWVLENGVMVNNAGMEQPGTLPYVGEELTINDTSCFSTERGGIQFGSDCNHLTLDNTDYSIVELNDSTLTLEEINYSTTLHKKLYYTK